MRKRKSSMKMVAGATRTKDTPAQMTQTALEIGHEADTGTKTAFAIA